MRETKDCVIFVENNEQVNEKKHLITDSNHGFTNVQEDIEKSEIEKYKWETSNDAKTTVTCKWQIMLTSANCTIRKHCQGWQVRKNCVENVIEF